MGPKKAVSKDDSALDVGTNGRLDDMREKLCEAYVENENVRRRNVDLEIENKNIESILREKDIELKYLSERMNKEIESVITEKDKDLQKMKDELQKAKRRLAEAQRAREPVSIPVPDPWAEQAGMYVNNQNVAAPVPQQFSVNGNYDVPLPRQMVYDGKTPYELFIRSFLTLADTCGWNDKARAFRLLNNLRGQEQSTFSSKSILEYSSRSML